MCLRPGAASRAVESGLPWQQRGWAAMCSLRRHAANARSGFSTSRPNRWHACGLVASHAKRGLSSSMKASGSESRSHFRAQFNWSLRSWRPTAEPAGRSRYLFPMLGRARFHLTSGVKHSLRLASLVARRKQPSNNASNADVRTWAWEQGKREPDGPTLRLLEVAEQHPEVLLERVRPRRRGKRTAAKVG